MRRIFFSLSLPCRSLRSGWKGCVCVCSTCSSKCLIKCFVQIKRFRYRLMIVSGAILMLLCHKKSYCRIIVAHWIRRGNVLRIKSIRVYRFTVARYDLCQSVAIVICWIPIVRDIFLALCHNFSFAVEWKVRAGGMMSSDVTHSPTPTAKPHRIMKLPFLWISETFGRHKQTHEPKTLAEQIITYSSSVVGSDPRKNKSEILYLSQQCQNHSILFLCYRFEPTGVATSFGVGNSLPCSCSRSYEHTYTSKTRQMSSMCLDRMVSTTASIHLMFGFCRISITSQNSFRILFATE